jgi:purine-binding chemotaxis protein CheW
LTLALCQSQSVVARLVGEETVGIAFASDRGPMIQSNQFLSFFIAGQEFAIRILCLSGVRLADGLSAFPLSDSVIRGILDYEGSLLPVIDVTAKFGPTRCPITPTTRVLIDVVTLDGERTSIGVLVEGISEAFELAKRRIQRAPIAMEGAEYLLGIAKFEDRSVPLIDLDRLLSKDDHKLIIALRSNGIEQMASSNAIEKIATDDADKRFSF